MNISATTDADTILVNVKTIKRMGDWINILDKSHNNFTLHLKDKQLAQLWCVKRPTADGIVTCIEGFDQFGSSILTVFGQRMEGTSELAAWQKITADISLDELIG